MMQTCRRGCLAAAIAVSGFAAGCQDSSQRYTTSQSGERVQAYRDDTGKDYYYERGAKVYMSQTKDTDGGYEPTNWNPP